MPPKPMYKSVNKIIEEENHGDEVSTKKQTLDLEKATGSKRKISSGMSIESTTESLSSLLKTTNGILKAKSTSAASNEDPFEQPLVVLKSRAKKATCSNIHDDEMPITDALKGNQNFGKFMHEKPASTNPKTNINLNQKMKPIPGESDVLVHSSSKGSGKFAPGKSLLNSAKIGHCVNGNTKSAPNATKSKMHLNQKPKFFSDASSHDKSMLGKSASNSAKGHLHGKKKDMQSDFDARGSTSRTKLLGNFVNGKSTSDTTKKKALLNNKTKPSHSDFDAGGHDTSLRNEVLGSFVHVKSISNNMKTNTHLKQRSMSIQCDSDSSDFGVSPRSDVLAGNMQCNKRVSITSEEIQEYGNMCESPLRFDRSDCDIDEPLDDLFVQRTSETHFPEFEENEDELPTHGPSEVRFAEDGGNLEDDLHVEEPVRNDEVNQQEPMCEAATTKKKTRGCTTYKAVAPPKGKKWKCVVDKQLGVPVANEDSKLAKCLGIHARHIKYFPIAEKWGPRHEMSFACVMDSLKDDFDFVMEDGFSKAHVDGVVSWCKEKIQRDIRNWRHKLKMKYNVADKSIEEQPQSIMDKRISDKQWGELLQYWDKPENKILASRNKAIRRVTGPTYTGGPISIATLRYNMKQEEGEEFTEYKAYFGSHLDRNNNFPNEKTKVLLRQVSQSCVEKGVENTQDPLVFGSVTDGVYGRHRGGHERGYGVGVSRRDMRNRKAKQALHSAVTDLQQELEDKNKKLEDMNEELVDARSKIVALERKLGKRYEMERREALCQKMLNRSDQSSRMLHASTPSQNEDSS